VFKLDRWARNAREDLVNDYLLEQAGAEVVSCSEQIDRTNAGRMVHTILASLEIKVQEGGTPGIAPLGYKNVAGGSRRYVVVDPRAGADPRLGLRGLRHWRLVCR
jgi:hypothetical protein